MTPTLADTSVWVSYLREGPGHPHGRELASALEAEALVICGPVAAELLTGTREHDRERLGRTLSALGWIDLDRRLWLEVGRLAARLRTAGITVALTDIEIAIAAVAGSAELLSADTDFVRIAEHEPRLRLRLLAS